MPKDSGKGNMTTIAVVGNRIGFERLEVFKYLDKEMITIDDTIVTGGAPGVDTYAMDYAKATGCKLIVYFPDPNMKSPNKYFIRNKKIAEECDRLIAFNRDTLEHSGTLYTANETKKLGKEVKIIGGRYMSDADTELLKRWF